MKKIIISVFLLLSSSSLIAATINFDSFSTAGSGFDGGFIGGVEAGFTIGVDGGSFLTTSGDFLGAFSGANSLHHGSAVQSGITLTNGGLFEFSSLQSGGFFGGAEPLTVVGLLSGGIVGTDVFNPLNGSYSLFSAVNLFGVTVDTLRIDMGPAGPGPTHIDDIVLNPVTTSPVPAPAAIWLLGSGLIGLIGIRKKSTKLSGNYA